MTNTYDPKICWAHRLNLRFFIGLGLSLFILIASFGCDKDEKVVPLEEGGQPRIAMVGIKFQYQLADQVLATTAPESGKVLYDRLTDKFLLSLESNLKKTTLVDNDELSEFTGYHDLVTTFNAKTEVIPDTFKFVDLETNPEWTRTLCDEAHLEYIFTVAVQVIPTQNQEPQLYVTLVVADKTGKITLKTQEPLGVFWRQLIKNNTEVGEIIPVDRDERRMMRKEGVDFGNSENRAILEHAFLSFLDRYKSLAPLIEGF